MKVAILSRAPRCYSTRRLRQAAAERGHTVKVLDTTRCSMLLEKGRPRLFFKGKAFSEYDAVVPRIGASVTFYGTAVVRQFERMGVFCLNSAEAIEDSRNKLRSLQLLSRHEIGIPPTAFVRCNDDISQAIESVGGAPVIIKLLEGTQGVGVILAETDKVAHAIVETLRHAAQNVLIQRFVAESRGRDVRAFVVGDRVVAAMRRTAQGQEFRSNVHRGGMASPLEIDPVYANTALHAARVLGLHVAGVDMLEGAEGPQIMEVNSSPGLQGIEGATGVDVAGAIMDYLAEQVERPNPAAEEQLTGLQEHGVAEVEVSEMSELVGERVIRSRLGDRDVIVLMMQHPGETPHHPGLEDTVRAGDRLLCYGRFEELKSFAPGPRRQGKGRRREPSATTKPRVVTPPTKARESA